MKQCEKNDLWSRKLPDNKAGRWQQIIRALGPADLRRGSGDAERMFTKLVVNSGQPSQRFMIYVLPWDPPSFPPSGATGVVAEVYGMISHRMRVPAWSFKPPWLRGSDNNALCIFPPECLFSPSAKSSSPLFSLLPSHPLRCCSPGGFAQKHLHI